MNFWTISSIKTLDLKKGFTGDFLSQSFSYSLVSHKNKQKEKKKAKENDAFSEEDDNMELLFNLFTFLLNTCFRFFPC